MVSSNSLENSRVRLRSKKLLRRKVSKTFWLLKTYQ